MECNFINHHFIQFSFNKNHNIIYNFRDELGITPNTQCELVFIDGKLGISSTLSKKLYIYAHKEFFKLRSKPTSTDCDSGKHDDQLVLKRMKSYLNVNAMRRATLLS